MQRILSTALLIGGLLLTGSVSAEVEIKRDVVYGHKDGMALVNEVRRESRGLRQVNRGASIAAYMHCEHVASGVMQQFHRGGTNEDFPARMTVAADDNGVGFHFHRQIRYFRGG